MAKAPFLHWALEKQPPLSFGWKMLSQSSLASSLAESPVPTSKNSPQPPLHFLLPCRPLFSQIPYPFLIGCQGSFVTCILHLLPPPGPLCLQESLCPWKAQPPPMAPRHLDFKGVPNPLFSTQDSTVCLPMAPVWPGTRHAHSGCSRKMCGFEPRM